MTPTIKLVMFSTTNILPYASLAARINRRYCRYHGYDFVHELYDNVRLAPQYEKVRVLRKHIGSAQYLLWIDSDACVVNFRQRIESFCKPDKDFITAGHDSGVDLAGQRKRYLVNGVAAGMNTGIMLFRDSAWSRQFLDEWWVRCEKGAVLEHALWEQGELQQMLIENTLDVLGHIDLVTPASRLNRGGTDGAEVCEFILHLWGSPSDYRRDVFKEIARGGKPEIGISMPFFDTGTPNVLPYASLAGRLNEKI